MAKAMKTSEVAKREKAISTLETAAGIKIERGAPPKLKAKAKSMSSLKFAHVYEAIETMEPDSWFLVPGTKGWSGKQLTGICGAIGRICKRLKITGVFAAMAEDGSGVVVRKVADGVEE